MGGILSYLQDILGGILSSSTKKSGGDSVRGGFCPTLKFSLYVSIDRSGRYKQKRSSMKRCQIVLHVQPKQWRIYINTCINNKKIQLYILYEIYTYTFDFLKRFYTQNDRVRVNIATSTRTRYKFIFSTSLICIGDIFLGITS